MKEPLTNELLDEHLSEGEVYDLLFPEQVLRVMPQLCDAVAELHEDFDSPIIHRDLKPPNVIVGFCVAAMCVHSFGELANPPETIAYNPRWLNVIICVFWVPAVTLIIGFAAWDKRYLKKRFPVLENLRVCDHILAPAIAFDMRLDGRGRFSRREQHMSTWRAST